MAVTLSPVGGAAAQFFTNSGVPLSGGKLYSYAAGTTTPLATYTTNSGATPWTNPIILDSAGRIPNSGEIWLTNGSTYKFILKDNNDVLIATYDNINTQSINAFDITYTPPFSGSTATNVGSKLAQIVSVIDFGADPTGTVDSTPAIQTAINYAAQAGNTLFFPAGTYLITTLTIPAQHGGIEWVGESNDSTYNLTQGLYKGTVLISTVNSGNVIYANGGVAYSNRGIEIKNISIKAQTSDFVIYFRRAPDRPLLSYVSIYNSNSAGSGVCFDSCFVGALITSSHFQGEVGASNIGVKVFNDEKAGGFVMENSSSVHWHKGLEFGVWVYEATIRNTGMEYNNYGAYIYQGDNNLTLDSCHFEFDQKAAIYIDNCGGVRIVKCSFYRNAESASGTKAQIYIKAGAGSYSNNTFVQNCYDFGLSSNTCFLYHENASFGNGTIDGNESSIVGGATGTKGVFLDGAGQEQWQVTNNNFASTDTPYTNCELAKQFSSGQDAMYGIRFAATSYPSSNPNTLDDYQEGTWTPVLGGDGGQSGQSYTRQIGYYQKIGSLVYFSFDVELSTKGTISSIAVLDNLPFTTLYDIGAGAGFVSDFTNLGVSVTNIQMFPNATQKMFYFRVLTAAGTSMAYENGSSLFTNTTMIRGGGWFKTAD